MSDRRIRVLVIGAGFSGLGAAHCLLSDPKFEVTILEGAEKVGGRVRSVQCSGDHTAELGCTFLYSYGHTTEPSLTKFAKDNGLVVAEIGDCDYVLTDTEEAPHLRLLSNGEEIPKQAAKHYQDLYKAVLDDLEETLERGDVKKILNRNGMKGRVEIPETWFEDYTTRRFQSLAAKDPIQWSSSGSWEPRHILQFMNAYEADMNGVIESRNIDPSTITDWTVPKSHLALSCTYQELADTLASDIPPECLHLGTEVRSIHWTQCEGQQAISTPSEAPVTVSCTDGTKYHADHIIITVSLGILQRSLTDPANTNNSGSLIFSPPLPREKRSAIASLEMGHLGKAVLEFACPLVDRLHCSVQLHWLKEDVSFPALYPWAARQYTIDRVSDSSTYCVWFTGDDAIAMEKATESEVAEAICTILEKFLKKPHQDRPLCVTKSSWSTDRLSMGSYSYQPIGTSGRDREILSEPISGRTPLQLLFAGEATHVTRFSTTEGAFESGIREARKLMDLHK